MSEGKAILGYKSPSLLTFCSLSCSNGRAGVFNGPCAANLNHAVTIVGYGARGNLPPINYWIVRNQWGSSWGQIGYIWMRAGVNLCSIESWAMYPVVKAL